MNVSMGVGRVLQQNMFKILVKKLVKRENSVLENAIFEKVQSMVDTVMKISRLLLRESFIHYTTILIRFCEINNNECRHSRFRNMHLDIARVILNVLWKEIISKHVIN